MAGNWREILDEIRAAGSAVNGVQRKDLKALEDLPRRAGIDCSSACRRRPNAIHPIYGTISVTPFAASEPKNDDANRRFERWSLAVPQ